MRMCEFRGGQVNDFSTQVKSKLKPVLIKFSFIREKSRYDTSIVFQRKMSFEQSSTISKKIAESKNISQINKFNYCKTKKSTYFH